MQHFNETLFLIDNNFTKRSLNIIALFLCKIRVTAYCDIVYGKLLHFFRKSTKHTTSNITNHTLVKHHDQKCIGFLFKGGILYT